MAEMENEELEALEGQIAFAYNALERSADWSEKGMILQRLNELLAIRDTYYSKSTANKVLLEQKKLALEIEQYLLKNEQIKAETEKASKINWGEVLKVGLQIGVPAIVTGAGIVISRKNVMDTFQFETEGRITSLAGKTIVGRSIK